MSDNKNNLRKTNSSSRPTSPHLQIYRWNISSITSIMHRLTGVILYFSVLIIGWFIVYYTYNTKLSLDDESCQCLFTTILNIVFFGAIIATTFSLFYHFCNGLRHLFWDIGKGFDLKKSKFNGYLVILTSLILTIATIATTLYLKLF